MNKITDILDLLLIEDNPGDVRIIQELLHDQPECKLFDVNSISSAFAYLDKNKTDLVLLDLGLPDSQGLDTVRKVVSQIPLIPVIVLTGFNDNELALASIKIGAQDYLIKGKIDADMFQRSIHHSIERKQLELALRESQANLVALTENSKDSIWSVDKQFCLITGNSVFHEHIKTYFGTRIETGENTLELGMIPESKELWRNYYQRVLNGERFNIEKEAHSAGETMHIDYAFNPLMTSEGEITGIVVSGRDITERRKSEETLIKLHKAIDASREVVFLTDIEGVFTFINPAFTSMYGYTPDEVIGKVTPRILKSGTIDNESYESFWKVLIGGEDFEGEYINKTKDSRFINIEGSATPIFNDEKKILGYLGIQRDITERKRAEDELRYSFSLLNASLESTADGILIVDGKGKIIQWNQKFAEMWKLPDEVLSTYDDNATIAFILIQLKDPDGFLNKVKKLYSTPESLSFEQFEFKDGRVFERYSQPQRIGDNIVGRVWSFRDVTERKQVEEKLKESEKKYRDLFNNDLAGNFITTVDGKIQLCNPAFVNIFGFNSIEDALQFNANRFYKNSQERKQLIKTLQEKKKLEFVEKELIRQDGKVITVLLNEIGEFDEKDKLVRMIGYLLDISERKEKQEEINQLNEELEQRVMERTAQLQAINKELESFSYSVSHDLRAPLRAIDGFTRILFEEYEPKLDEEGKRLCEMIRENTLRMGKLIDDLLSFSRLSRIDLNISRIDMQKLANSAYDEITLPEQRQRIDFHLGEIAAVHGDRTLLQQVWINLISNAIKFSSRREHALIRISSKLEKKRVVYSIMDNGAGFDMKYVDKLFGVFQRLHSVKEFEGTGVGLAIVQHIIIRHGGQVWAEGEVDNGATFYFSLPLEARGKRQ